MSDLRRGQSITIDNDLGLQLTLVRWDDDHLTVEISDGPEGNDFRLSVEFGIAGEVEDLRALFA